MTWGVLRFNGVFHDWSFPMNHHVGAASDVPSGMWLA